jgi:hypothetical protein
MKRILLSVMVLALLMCASSVAVEYPEGTLYRGIYGYTEEIEFLQYQLFYAGYLGDDVDEVDGIFGQRTEEAVKQLQQDHGIDVTGIVCPNTVMMLDKIWEDSMEPQDADPGLFCATNHYANGTAYVTLCQRHMDLYAQAAALLDEAQDDFQLIEGLQSGITLWMEDADSLYESWKEIRPEEIGEKIDGVQEAFMEYYRASLALWNLQYGSPSMAALELARTMMSDHCVDLCCMLNEIY